VDGLFGKLPVVLVAFKQFLLPCYAEVEKERNFEKLYTVRTIGNNDFDFF
jgi:hypothetical protein